MRMLVPEVLAQTPPPQHGMIMGLIIWLFIGAIAGFLASKIVNKSGDGLLLDIVLGLIGSVVGGFVFGLFGIAAYGLIGSIVVAMIGAILVLVIYHSLIGKRST